MAALCTFKKTAKPTLVPSALYFSFKVPSIELRAFVEHHLNAISRPSFLQELSPIIFHLNSLGKKKERKERKKKKRLLL